jgi:hypothetical protein
VKRPEEEEEEEEGMEMFLKTQFRTVVLKTVFCQLSSWWIIILIIRNNMYIK